MEKLIVNFKQGLIHGLGIVLVIGVFVFGFYLVKGVTFNEGEVITSTKLNSIVPSGFVGAFNLTTCPTGWKPADGTDGTPDLRGQFLRGLNTFDNGNSVRSDGKQDIDGVSRTLGSYQTDQYKSHSHGIKNRTGYAMGSTAEGMSQNGNTQFSAGTELSGGTETRPKNVAVIYCVKE